MSNIKPREFWIDPKDMNQVYMRRQPNKIILDQFILVREVLPDEPDWKAIAQELAEVLKAESNFFVNCYKARHSEKVQKALAKFNKFKESAVSEE